MKPVRVYNLLGHLGAGHGSGVKALSFVVGSPLDHMSWKTPLSLMFLEVLGYVSRELSVAYVLSSRACPGSCFYWCHQLLKCGCCLGSESSSSPKERCEQVGVGGKAGGAHPHQANAGGKVQASYPS